MTVLTAIRDIDRLSTLYTAGFQDPFLDNALHKLIERQIMRDEADLARVNAELAQFEQQYSLTSDAFWQRFQGGQMADTADFMEWNIFCKMRQRLLTRLAILHDSDAHE